MSFNHYEKELDIGKDFFFWEEDSSNDERHGEWEEQRKKYGFDVREVWNLYTRIAVFIYPRLRMFRDSVVSRPSNLTMEEWYVILDKMIFTFKKILEYNHNNEMTEKEWKQYNEGFDLFKEYFFDL